MRVPGVVATALFTAMYAFVQALANGVSVLEQWWVPVAVAILGALLKWLEVARAKPEGQWEIAPESKLERFLLG